MDEQTIRQKVRDYIRADLIRDPDYPLGDDERLVTSGMIDVMGLAQLAVFIENAFGVYIPDPDLTVENMDNLDLIMARIMRGLK